MSVELIRDLKPIQNGQLQLSDLEGLATSENPKSNCLIFIKDKKFFNKFQEKIGPKPLGNLSIVLEEKFFQELSEENKSAVLKNAVHVFTCVNSMLTMLKFGEYFYTKKIKQFNDVVDGRQTGSAQIHRTANISQNVFIGAGVIIEAGVTIMPGSVIMSYSRIGKDTLVYPNVSIYPETLIGSECIIHSGVTIGSDGFGYQFHQGQHLKIQHLGKVVIGDKVEIGANTTIDRGTIDDTFIGSGTKLDNLVHVAHNCRIDQGAILCGQVGLGGSAKLGAYVVLGGKAAVAPDTEVGAQSQIAGMAGVTGKLEEKSKVAGHPARPLNEWLRGVALIRRLVAAEKNKE